MEFPAIFLLCCTSLSGNLLGRTYYMTYGELRAYMRIRAREIVMQRNLKAYKLKRFIESNLCKCIRLLTFCLPFRAHGISSAPENDAMQSDGAAHNSVECAARSRSLDAPFFARTEQQFMLSVFSPRRFCCLLCSQADECHNWICFTPIRQIKSDYECANGVRHGHAFSIRRWLFDLCAHPQCTLNV